jgi:hypothetical protein
MPQHVHARMGQKTFGMELHAEQRFGAVLDGHDFARTVGGIAPGGHFQFLGQCVGLDHEAVITGGLKRIVDALKQGAAVVADLIDLAVHESTRADDLSAEGLADGLMPQADAQDRQLAGEFGDTFDRDAGFAGGAGTGRDNEPVGLAREDFVDGDLVVAVDLDVERGVDLTQALDQVVGEGVVVIDDLNHELIVIGGMWLLNDQGDYGLWDNRRWTWISR